MLKHRYIKYGTTDYSILKLLIPSTRMPITIQRKLLRAMWNCRHSIFLRQSFWERRISLQYLQITMILTSLAFQREIRLHFMSGRVSWHSQAASFSTPALYNTLLPTEIDVRVDPFDYAIPSDVSPLMSYIAK
ncbi:hypothetical protein PHMEG_00015015 [Phytophthora megakarya]|uniref:Uncharacterized protein n=1 Tax=Phytophthora megakarya TaxID=4795 RepID=A0A225W2I3_9STRA|nr:hypothetical protein PHMEG_00015015 [Phytophthora megakarya]